MAGIKEIMGMDINAVRALGAEMGLTFHAGMRKSEMAQQLANHAASGWMEVNKELLHGTYGEEGEHFSGLSDSAADTISDAARTAQMLDAAGFTGTFHNVMGSGSPHALDAINHYMDSLGVNSQDVWLHLPKPNPEMPAPDFKLMQAYLRDNLADNQDFMGRIEGHYSGDIMAEYATNRGNVNDSFNYLSHIYLDKNSYSSRAEYNSDLNVVSRMLAEQMSGKFKEVALASANNVKAGYHSILPQVGDETIASRVRYPRQALNAAGLPLGSTGSAVGDRGHYSLISSLTGRPEDRGPAAAALREEIGSTLRSLADKYNGNSPTMRPFRLEEEHDPDKYRLLDAATRYMDVSDARAAYEQLDEDERPYTTHALNKMLESPGPLMESESRPTFDPREPIRNTLNSTNNIRAGTNFAATFGAPQSYNSARSRREWKEIADLDAAYANFRDVSDGASSGSTVQYHNLEQGTPEWFAMRQNYDITGSTVGGYLGNNPYTRPWKQMVQKLGFDAPKPNHHMERGHRLEPIARQRVSEELGTSISEVGAITNSMYPNMMYSPDGLIGDDALWEHKAPQKFFDLEKDHPDYVDQVQLGMLLSGRNRTLFSQTVGSETRSQWIDCDESWYDRNRSRLDSVVGRLQAGRAALPEGYDVSDKGARDVARRAMEGNGLWMDISQKSTKGYSELAGTDADPFAASSRTYNPNVLAPSDYTPNFITSAGDQLMNVAQPGQEGPQTGMALAVKQGILAAREETKRQEGSAGAAFEQADADFDELGQPGNRNYAKRMRDAFGNDGGRGGSGGRGGGSGGAGGFGGGFGNSLERGIASGSLQGIGNGLTAELMQGGALSKAGGVIKGLMQVSGQFANLMNDYVGTAEDYGSTNPYGFSAQQQSLEMMGLNANQAESANKTVGSVFNRMANGDPSGAAQIAVATRGLLTPTDVRNSQGNPVALATIARQRAQERGWSQARFAGAMEMAGLGGFARTLGTSDQLVGAAQANVDEANSLDPSELSASARKDNAVRAKVSPGYVAPRDAGLHFNAINGKMSGAMTKTYNLYRSGTGFAEKATDTVGNALNKSYEFTESHKLIDGPGFLNDLVEKLESGGDPNATNPHSTAKGSMQVLDGTARDPGYGVQPAQDDSLEERARVGRDYLGALVRHYDGDTRKASAAYVAGPGDVDRAASKYGDNWLDNVRPEARKRVADLEKMGAFSAAGAGTFRDAGSTGPSVGTINVNITAKVNGKEATATAQVRGGPGSTQTVNMGGVAAQRR